MTPQTEDLFDEDAGPGAAAIMTGWNGALQTYRPEPHRPARCPPELRGRLAVLRAELAAKAEAFERGGRVEVRARMGAFNLPAVPGSSAFVADLGECY